MTIHFTADSNDYTEWAFHYSRTDPDKIRRLRWSRILLAIMIFSVPLTAVILGRYQDLWLTFAYSAIAVAVWLSLPSVIARSTRTRIRKLFAKPENAKHLGQRTISINDEGLTSISENATALYQWKAIEKIDVTPNYAYVRVGSSGAMVIPRAKVEDGHFDAFVEEALRLQSQAAAGQTAFPQRAI